MYLELLAAHPRHCSAAKCHEQSVGYNLITERHIQAMWLEQKYFKDIKTSDGHTIEVVSAGIWNAESGPDFLKAHLRINGADLLGDIELHLSDDSWYSHNHHTDPAYDNVVLHVGYWLPKRPIVITTSLGYNVPCVHLEKHLTIPESRLLKLIDLDLYPYHRFSGSGKCSSELFRKLSPDETVNLLSSAALWRLNQKWLHIEARMENSSDVLIGGIAAALGYKHNSGPFLEVFRRLSMLDSSNEHQLLMETLAICGFFHETYRKRWFYSTYYQRLAAMYDGGVKKHSHIGLQLDHIRPANHPIRRLAYMTALLVHKNELQKLPEQIENLWEVAKHGKKEWKEFKEQLFLAIPQYENRYWLRHYAFEAEEQPKEIAWMGNELKREIVVNVILPFLYNGISHRGDRNEIAMFTNFYSSLQATKAKKTSYLSHRLFGDDKKSVLMGKANIQQGAYQIHKDFCIHYEASCEGCPFVSKFQSITAT